jgi:FkbM family methyltransferase
MFSRHYYSENGEDIILLSYFEDKPASYKGFYVDIGAHHPIRLSNTQLFYELGWDGVNIDANPGSMRVFNIIRKRDINLESGVSDGHGALDFYVYGAGSNGNTFDKMTVERRNNMGVGDVKQIIRVNVEPINDILEKHLPKGKHIDFITIDVEGFETRILQSFDFKKYAPDFFLLEDLGFTGITRRDFIEYQTTPVYKLLRDKGYVVLAKSMRTVIWGKDR